MASAYFFSLLALIAPCFRTIPCCADNFEEDYILILIVLIICHDQTEVARETRVLWGSLYLRKRSHLNCQCKGNDTLRLSLLNQPFTRASSLDGILQN
jgi:hypothetical protein